MGNGVLEIVTDAYQNRSEHYIEVRDEESKDIILRSHLTIENNYEVQKDSVICWNDVSQQEYEDLAISFESQG